MNWKLKALPLAVLDRIPCGAAVYHKLQKLVGTNPIDFTESLRRAVDLIELIGEAGGRTYGAHVLEIGSGWRPWIPMVLRLAGAQRVRTLDVHPWMDESYVKETYRALRENLLTVALQLSRPVEEVKARFPDVDVDAVDWREILDRFHVEYACPGDARATGLGESSVEIVVSSNVLEHVTAADLDALHRESYRILKPGGLAVHRFNPGDHFAAVDDQITCANFLRYSQSQWTRMTRTLAFHNRLRCPQHQALLQDAGFEIAVARARVDERSLSAIRDGQVPIHAEFQRFSLEELASDYMWLAGQKPVPVVDQHTGDQYLQPVIAGRDK